MTLLYKILLTLCLFTTICLGQAQVCYQPGEFEGIILNITTSPSYNDCLEGCTNYGTCNYFTLDGDLCIFYLDVVSLSDTICPDCISGQVGCPRLLKCNQPGTCKNGTSIYLAEASSIDQCIEECQSLTGCQFCTFYETYQVCDLLRECPSIDESTCSDACVTNEKECPPLLKCNEQGSCQNGTSLHFADAANVNQCIVECETLASCQYSTFYESLQMCQLLENCPYLDDTCGSDCITNEKNCTLIPPGYNMTLLFAVGGYSSSGHDTEAVDLSGQHRNCQAIADCPLSGGSSGAFIGGFALVCGTINPFNMTDKCYGYNASNNTWRFQTAMTTGRAWAAGVMYNLTHWWITGGWDDGTRSSTELYNVVANEFTLHVELPETKEAHNLVRVNETHIMLTGDWDPTRKSWMFDQIREEWTELPDSLESRAKPFSGLVTFQNGTKIVILAGGANSNSAEAFDLQGEKWISGIPDLPVEFELYDGCSVPFEDTFLIVGGYKATGPYYQKSIIAFDQAEMNWKTLDEELDVPRSEFASFLVPEDYVTCT